MTAVQVLKKWRENYYVSNALAAVARPAYLVSQRLSGRLKRTIRKNGVAVRLPNGQILRFARDAGVDLASLLFWSGMDGFEPKTAKTLCFFFERSATFVDVGANYGYYSMLAALWNPQLRVVSFEPVPQIYKGLQKNIALNGIGDRVEPYQVALSDTTGRANFLLPPSEGNDLESTGTLVSDGWQSRKQSTAFEVETVRFDDFEGQHPMKLDVVKIDVEDFEAGVLRGMQKTILRDRPFIVTEVLWREHKNEKTRLMIESLGYMPYWITPSGYVRVSNFDFKRKNNTDFLLSPVSVPGEVISDLELLWARRQHRD